MLKSLLTAYSSKRLAGVHVAGRRRTGPKGRERYPARGPRRSRCIVLANIAIELMKATHCSLGELANEDKAFVECSLALRLLGTTERDGQSATPQMTPRLLSSFPTLAISHHCLTD